VQADGRRAEAAHGPEIDRIVAGQGGSDTCVMLYTSGTTGRPKGVVLSNDNILKTSRASAEFDKLRATDQILAYLPLAWVGDFIFSMGQSYVTGFCVCCPESAETMMADLREIGPTYFFAPPRIFETLLTTVMIRMEDAGPLKRRMFHHFIEHAKRVGPDLLDGKRGLMTGRAQAGLGGRPLQVLAREPAGLRPAEEHAGHEPRARRLHRGRGDRAGDLPVLPGARHQPEAALRPDRGLRLHHPAARWRGAGRHGGRAVAGRRGEDRAERRGLLPLAGRLRRILQEPESTADTKDPEGWVATGDAGFFEEATGHLRIIDRAKDVGKLTGGALFAPKYVENKLKFYPNILEAVVIGHERDHCVAMLNIDLAAVGAWAERNNVSYASYQELAGHPRVYEQMQAHVEEVNRSLAEDPMLSACQVHRFLVLHKELDADDGELTRTRKVRRRIIAERYAPLIEALYDGSPRSTPRPR
jgi:long-chain acyl-CoA synthetase